MRPSNRFTRLGFDSIYVHSFAVRSFVHVCSREHDADSGGTLRTVDVPRGKLVMYFLDPRRLVWAVRAVRCGRKRTE